MNEIAQKDKPNGIRGFYDSSVFDKVGFDSPFLKKYEILV